MKTKIALIAIGAQLQRDKEKLRADKRKLRADRRAAERAKEQAAAQK
jgi:hypothetical protein